MSELLPSYGFPLPEGTPPLPPAYASPEGFVPRHESYGHIQEIQIHPLQTALNGVKESFGKVQAWRQERKEARKEKKQEKLEDKIEKLEQKQAFRQNLAERAVEAITSEDISPRNEDPISRSQRRAEKRLAKRSKKARQRRKTLGGDHSDLHGFAEFVEYSGTDFEGKPFTKRLTYQGPKAHFRTFGRKVSHWKKSRSEYKSGEIDAFEKLNRKIERKTIEAKKPAYISRRRARKLFGGETRAQLDALRPMRYKQTERRLARIRKKHQELEDDN